MSYSSNTEHKPAAAELFAGSLDVGIHFAVSSGDYQLAVPIARCANQRALRPYLGFNVTAGIGSTKALSTSSLSHVTRIFVDDVEDLSANVARSAQTWPWSVLIEPVQVDAHAAPRCQYFCQIA